MANPRSSPSEYGSGHGTTERPQLEAETAPIERTFKLRYVTEYRGVSPVFYNTHCSWVSPCYHYTQTLCVVECRSGANPISREKQPSKARLISSDLNAVRLMDSLRDAPRLSKCPMDNCVVELHNPARHGVVAKSHI